MRRGSSSTCWLTHTPSLELKGCVFQVPQSLQIAKLSWFFLNLRCTVGIFFPLQTHTALGGKKQGALDSDPGLNAQLHPSLAVWP